ncbi:uncharacterized protein LOC114296888 [Camellia sinensis]|uniref:uncharacterized protein LOC114296888 n=1 Tax=Camellia sinensis TaxID=4442 RepID=UPI001035B71F|nr:uncharacterized protein LOC114296888 [Camellia sinensis]
MDQLTEQGSRVSFARVCVEVEAASTLPAMFKVDCEGAEAIVKVKYQGLLLKCEHCIAFGHDTARCVKTQVATLINSQKEVQNHPDPGWETVMAKGKRKVGVPNTSTELASNEEHKEDGTQQTEEEQPEMQAQVESAVALPDQTYREVLNPIDGEQKDDNMDGLVALQKELVEITSLFLPHDTELMAKVENLVEPTPGKAQTSKQAQAGSSTKDYMFRVCFVYAGNKYEVRKDFFEYMVKISQAKSNTPLVILGDFNAIRFPYEKSGGSISWSKDKKEFNSHILQAELVDLSYGGCQFTWANKRTSGDYIASKIDRVLVNEAWLDAFPASFATFLPSGISDHSPAVIHISDKVTSFKKPFKYFDFWADHEDFCSVVSTIWNQYIQGVPMFRVCQKLKNLKPALKALNKKDFSDITTRVHTSRSELLSLSHVDLLAVEESLAHQKSRVQWLSQGDSNSRFFFKTIKGNINRGKILNLEMMNGQKSSKPEDIHNAFIDFFAGLFGTPIDDHYNGFDRIHSLVKSKISSDQSLLLASPVTDQEIKDTFWSLKANKAPGPDGFSVGFFKCSWNIVGREVTQAIRTFFESGRLLSEVNCTIIALIPKVPNPVKIIANRIKTVLPDLVDPVQSAFVQGRRISDNIFLSQELMRGYHRKSPTPKCAMKVDIMKAYDSVRWEFIIDILKAIAFPPIVISWIQQMEILAKILVEKSMQPMFKFHWRCEKTKIINLCFADDLMIFSKGYVPTVKLIMEGLEEFSNLSGLTPNPSKSNIYFSGCEMGLRASILDVTKFKEGTLPVKYLGVPLITTKLRATDCAPLIDRITKRVKNWTNRTLSYAGRSQLIQSILFSMQVYWSSLFILPKKVIREIESILRAFLWSGSELKTHSAKIAWDSVCTPKNEGGLGFKSLDIWNKAAIAKHVWFLFFGGEKSMWCQWVKSYLLKGRSFWRVKIPPDPSWVWRKIFSLRDWMSPLINHQIGCGTSTFLWYDNWHPLGPLWNKFEDRIMYDSCLNSEAKVSQIIDGHSWKWPIPNSWEIQELISSTPECYKPNPSKCDQVIWKLTTDGQFSIHSVWNHWRHSLGRVEWHKLLWGPHRIPKVHFIVWGAIHNRLYTGDRLLLFGLAPHSQCPFCLDPGESHSHLFFKCNFTNRVWGAIEAKCNIKWPVLDWPDIVTYATKETKGNSLRANILSNAFLCSIYHIWIERNNRVFNKKFKPEEVVFKSVIQMVRSRMLSIKNLPNSASDSWVCSEFPTCGFINGKEAQVEWCEPLNCGLSGVRSYIEGIVSVLKSSRLYLICWRNLLMAVLTGSTIMYEQILGCMGRQWCPVLGTADLLLQRFLAIRFFGLLQCLRSAGKAWKGRFCSLPLLVTAGLLALSWLAARMINGTGLLMAACNAFVDTCLLIYIHVLDFCVWMLDGFDVFLAYPCGMCMGYRLDVFMNLIRMYAAYAHILFCLATIYIDKIARLDGVPVSIVLDRNSKMYLTSDKPLKAMRTELGFSAAFHLQIDV